MLKKSTLLARVEHHSTSEFTGSVLWEPYGVLASLSLVSATAYAGAKGTNPTPSPVPPPPAGQHARRMARDLAK